MKKITKEEIITKLKELQEDDDFEIVHDEADKLLCAFLTSLGYKDVVNEWRKVGKFY